MEETPAFNGTSNATRWATCLPPRAVRTLNTSRNVWLMVSKTRATPTLVQWGGVIHTRFTSRSERNHHVRDDCARTCLGWVHWLTAAGGRAHVRMLLRPGDTR